MSKWGAAPFAPRATHLEDIGEVRLEAEADRRLDRGRAVVGRTEPPVARTIPEKRPHGQLQGPERELDPTVADPIRASSRPQ